MNLIRSFMASGLCWLALLGWPAQAQTGPPARRPTQPGKHLSQLDNARIAFLTARLTLTQDQAQRFWPVYNDFVARRRELNRSARLLRRDTNNPALSETQLRDNFTQDFALRQQQLNLEKDYFDKAQKVLTLHQLAQLYQAERDFTKEVLQHVGTQPAASRPE